MQVPDFLGVRWTLLAGRLALKKTDEASLQTAEARGCQTPDGFPPRPVPGKSRAWASPAAWLARLTCAVVVAGHHPVSAQPSPTGGFCSPPALGAPCANGGLAVSGNHEPTPGFSLGNPIHLASGNKYQLEVDLPPNATAPGLELIRHYNSLSTQAGTLGRNWTLSYDTRLEHRQGQWRLRQADGSLIPISPPLPTQNGYRWVWPNGQQLQFDADGRLVRIQLGRDTLVRLMRHAAPHPLAGLIQRVESTSGHTLVFHYDQQQGQPLIRAVDTPLGRFHYRYGLPDPDSLHASHRLEAVQRPDGMERLYHYEAQHQSGNPYALTGVSLSPGDHTAYRLASWSYDLFGRVISLQRYGQSLPRLHVDYVRSASSSGPGLTRIRSETGASGSVVYQRINGQYRLLKRVTDTPETAASQAHDHHATSGLVGARLATKAGEQPEVSYDAQGRLTRLGESQLLRSAHGALTALLPQAPGWPELAIHLQANTGTHVWQSRATGQTRLQADARGRPTTLLHENGDRLQVAYDAQGRVVQLTHTGGYSRRSDITRLRWRGRRLEGVEHPSETETRRYDAHGRLSERLLQRPALLGAPPARFRERFHYDEAHRLTRHELPEGGALHYAWRGYGPLRSRLASLHWEDAQGRRHTVIQSQAEHAGYRHGNGLNIVTEARHGPHADTLTVFTSQGDWVWRQERRYDPAGRLQHDLHDFPQTGHRYALSLIHDKHSRLQGAALHPAASTAPAHGSVRWWYAWQATGALAALNRNGSSHTPDIQRDRSGLPTALEGRALRYGPSRRLEAVVSESGTVVAEYRHNAYGHRIIRRAGASTIHFLYTHDRLVAEAQVHPEAPLRITRRYLYAGLSPVAMIDYPPDGTPRLYAIHADLSGAPRMVTDDTGQVRWLASYTPTGKALRLAGELVLPLRLPGQYADPETGWHDNLLRTYDAEAGHYLEPDPIGPLPGTDTYGYARQQPWRYADPHGLLLFAFDGTRYSADSMSNAWLLAQAYRDGPAHYHSGPGNSLYLDWDAVTAWRAGRILENQWQALLTSLAQQPAGTVVPIDIVGFSRGAALARHFGNRIASHMNNGLFTVDDPRRGRIAACVDLRFMGLFDTVTQFGIAGSHNHLYDFSVAELWSWVSHAVALHEHRWAFPLTRADAGSAGNVVEAPFVGAHADIGGGIALHDPPAGAEAAPSAGPQESDLAKVALAWMHWQAQAASVNFDSLGDITVHHPVLRDMRSPLARTLQRGDRAVYAPSGHLHQPYQDDDLRLGRQTREQVEAFIERHEDWRSHGGEAVGTVDMQGYSRWLEETLGWSPA